MKGFLQRILQEIMKKKIILGTSDDWSMIIPLTQQPTVLHILKIVVGFLVNSLSYMFKEIFILLLNSILIKICTGTKLSSSIYVTESKNHSWQLSFIVSAQLKVDNGKKLGIYCVIIMRMGGGTFSPHFPSRFLQQIWQIVE